VNKIERILARLDESTEPDNMDLPGFRLYPLKGELAGFASGAPPERGASSRRNRRRSARVCRAGTAHVGRH
jgi:hypothetical protein